MIDCPLRFNGNSLSGDEKKSMTVPLRPVPLVSSLLQTKHPSNFTASLRSFLGIEKKNSARICSHLKYVLTSFSRYYFSIQEIHKTTR